MAASPEEIEAAKTAESAGTSGAALGGGIGTVLGGLGGLGAAALTGPLSVGTALPFVTGGASLGGSLGSAIGGGIGGGIADDAQEKVSAGETERAEEIEQERLYAEALDRLMRTS